MVKLKKMKISLRLLAAFSVMVLLAAAIGFVGIRQINKVWEKVENIYQHPLQVSNAVRDIQINITAIHRTMKDVVLSESVEELQSYRNIIAEHEKNINKYFDVIFDRFLGNLTDVQLAYDAFAEWEPIRNEVISLYSKGKKAEAAAVTKGRGADHVAYMTNAMNVMVDYATNKSVEFYNEALIHRNNLVLFSLGLLLLTIAAAVAIGLIMFYTTIKPILTMRDKLQELLITNQEQSEQILNLSEYRFNLAIESSPLPVMVHADDGEVLMLSRSWQKLTGYELQDIPTITEWVRSAYPDRRDFMKKYIDNLYSLDAMDIHEEQSVRCKDGSHKVWTFNSVPLGKSNDGRNILMSMAVDLTQSKMDAEILAAEKEKLSVTLRSIGDGVITTDVYGHIQLMNRVAEDLTGWKQQEAVGKLLEDVFIIIHEDNRKTHQNPVEKVMLSGEVIELANHTLLIARDGTERVIADSGAPIRNRDSEIIGVVLVFRDQTEARKLQNRMQRNEKLESLGILAGGLAHDFNNLLGGLFGYIELAEDISSEVEVKSYLANAMDVFHRAKGITKQLLTFSKGGDPIRKSLQIDDLVKKNAAFILAGTSIAISYQIDDDLWLCQVDENQIGQVIDNLIINARQAMPDGGAISVRIENFDAACKKHLPLESGKYVAVSIEDSGIGIPIENIRKVFDPFFTTKSSGTGLGLATCYSIIKRHDGIIDVLSTPGKGSTFTFYLPKSDQDVSFSSQTVEIMHNGNGSVLVLDDERYMQDIVRQLVEEMGYAVLTAGDGDKALQLVKDVHSKGEKISAALLDLTIPGGLGGYEILEELKTIFPECMYFATSGYSNNPIMSEPEKFGFHDSLHKPYKKQELQTLFSRNLENSKRKFS